MTTSASFLRGACGLGLAALAAWPVLAGDLSAIKVPPRFTRPAANTDEGGLWGMMDREEKRVRRSPASTRCGCRTSTR